MLKNILLSTRRNKLRAANLFFDEKIRDVEYLSAEIDWPEIDSFESLNTFIQSVKVGKSPEGIDVKDAKFKLAIPGAIDAHVHFNTPGFESHDTFNEASTAAAMGGVTTIIDMPCTSLPPVTSADNFSRKYEAVRNRSLVDFAFWGGVRGNDFFDGKDSEKQIKELDASGVAAFKVYVLSGMKTFKELTYAQIEEVARIVRETGKPLGVHAEDKGIVTSVRAERQNAGKTSWRDYCAARSIEAEAKAVSEMIAIAERTNCRIHIVHLSSAKALDLIEHARDNGIPVSAETCPQYLQFTQKDFENFKISNFLKTAPPVKHEEDKYALWKGLSTGSISYLSTDHAGCVPELEKSSANFWEVYGGFPGVQHRVQFLISEGFKKGRLTLEQTIAHLSKAPAEFFALSGKGKLDSGFDADIALIDLWSGETVNSSEMKSKGKYTPFEGIYFGAKIEEVFLRGKIIKSETHNCEERIGYGNLLRVT